MDEPGRPFASQILRPDSSTDEPSTRGFLICDLRGYTDFVETHGDGRRGRAARRLRGLVRDIRSTGSGEIRTEGESFYVVFRSASAAVPLRAGDRRGHSAGACGSSDPTGPA